MTGNASSGADLSGWQGNSADFAEVTNVGDFLRRQAENRGHCEALVQGDVRLTYKQLHARAEAIAQQLQELKLAHGDKLGLLFPNHCDYVAAFFAAMFMGVVVVPINPLLRSEEIAHILTDSQAKAIITDKSKLSEVVAAVGQVPNLEFVLLSGGGEIPACPVKILRLTDKRSLDKPFSGYLSGDANKQLAVLVYTSGTTGKPKGAMLAHSNLIFAAKSAQSSFDVSAYDRFLAVLPLCHIYGLAIVMLGIIARGGILVVSDKFEAAATLKLIAQEAVTFVPAVPAMYQFMLMELDKQPYDLSAVRLCLSGAAPLPPELIERIETAFQAPLVEGYALTEVSCVGSINPLHGPRKPGSVGPAFPGVQIAVFDDSRKVLPGGADNVGEVAIKGPNVMQGYYRQPQASAESFQDGWFFTGDLGYCDTDGYLTIVGRKKEMILRGGQNIYPREVEEIILRLAAVLEVAVVGVPDPYMGERVKAVVVVKPGQAINEEQVKAHCGEFLAEYKVPRLVEFIEALPRNSTGKVLKRLLQPAR